MSEKQFSLTLAGQGLQKRRGGKGNMVWTGIKLMEEMLPGRQCMVN
jgi:hypothetical protein